MSNLWDDSRVKRGMQAQLARRKALLAGGEKHLGWKMGFGAPAAMAKLNTTAAVTGFLLQSALRKSGATVGVKGWKQLAVEPEIAARMARDLPPGSNSADAVAAVASLTPAIEVADLDFIADASNIDAVVAANIYQRNVVLSEHSRAGGSTAGLTSRTWRRGREDGFTAEPEALTGKVPDILVHLANMLGAFGEKLAAGDLVICGSTLLPVWIEADEDGYEHELAPVGKVSVRFSRN